MVYYIKTNLMIRDVFKLSFDRKENKIIHTCTFIGGYQPIYEWGTLCTLHLKLIVAFNYDRYEVPPVILVLKEDSAGYLWSCIFVFFIAH